MAFPQSMEIEESSSVPKSVARFRHDSKEYTAEGSEEATPLADTMLEIQVASDLHIEFYHGKKVDDDIVIPRAPVLALLGDIGLAGTKSLREFLLQQSDRFERVLFLPGNHEFYNQISGPIKTVEEQLEWMQAVCDARPNLTFLHNKSIHLNGVRVCGTTLWSEIPDDALQHAERSLNDYHLSYCNERTATPSPEGTAATTSSMQRRKLNALDTRGWFRDNVRWLERELEQAQLNNEPVVVLTHHTPLIKGTSDPIYDNSNLNCCFSTDLLVDPGFLKYQSVIQAWACGHTHYNFDIVVGARDGGDGESQGRGVRLVSNQRGYRNWINPDYQPDGLVLKIPSRL